MSKIVINTRDELTMLETSLVAVVKANGNYCTVYYINKREILLTPVFVNGTPKSFEAVFFDQVIDGLLVFIHLHDGRPLPPGLWKRIC